LIGVVTTTIQIPRNLPEIYRNTLLYDRADEVQYYIIGDKGTPVTRIQKYLGSRMANFQEPSYTLNRGQWNPGVNIGLWIGDPDIEAISRIGCPDIVVDLPLTIQFHSLGVEKNNFTSMCLQNLSFKTDVLVTQYEFPMNVQMGSLKLGRYDDIWAGYVCKKILDRIDRHMIFGPPIAEHRRNPHDLFKDLINEFWGMYLNSFFYTAIQEITLEEKDAFSCFIELITKLSKRIRFTDSDINGYFLRVFTDMLLWAEMIDKLF